MTYVFHLLTFNPAFDTILSLLSKIACRAKASVLLQQSPQTRQHSQRKH